MGKAKKCFDKLNNDKRVRGPKIRKFCGRHKCKPLKRAEWSAITIMFVILPASWREAALQEKSADIHSNDGSLDSFTTRAVSRWMKWSN